MTSERNSKFRPAPPTHRLKVVWKDGLGSSEVGAAWLNEKGHLTIKLNNGITLYWRDIERITLFLVDLPASGERPGGAGSVERALVAWRSECDLLRAEVAQLREALDHAAAYPCSYGDDCKESEGHVPCVSCRARRALGVEAAVPAHDQSTKSSEVAR